ncbi:MAG: ATP-binding protein [Gemmatimonadaceae bacterium]|nr:ATP-binding protein [Gemmatimonadaceae bacterium]
MLNRRLLPQISARLRESPAVVLLGPRQIGKTTLAQTVAATRRGTVYLDLQDPADQRRLHDPAAFLRAQGRALVVLDEIHRAPEVLQTLRGVIDQQRRQRIPGRFLLLGSASLELMRQSETLAGRVSYLELTGITAAELPGAGPTTQSLWVRGGFPRSLLARSAAASLRWRQDFIRSYLERDVPMFAPRLPAATISRLWGMLAHGQGTLLNHARLAGALGVSAPAVARYVDLLVDLLLVRRLAPWSGNVGKRLVRSPKTYIRDSGLLHALLEIETPHALLGHPVVGASWEGFVIENLLAAAGDRYVATFYRTEDGAEVDLVLERGGVVEFAIEIKRSTAPELTKSFRLACDALRPKSAYIIHGGEDEWPMGQNIRATSLRHLMARLDLRR